MSAVRNVRAWIVGVIVGLLVLGLIAFARGLEHQRGPQIESVASVGLLQALT